MCVVGRGTTTFAETFGATEQEAHEAGVIVKRAVNSFRAMLEALKEIHELSVVIDTSDYTLQTRLEWNVAMKKIKDAIALAENKGTET